MACLKDSREMKKWGPSPLDFPGCREMVVVMVEVKVKEEEEEKLRKTLILQKDRGYLEIRIVCIWISLIK